MKEITREVKDHEVARLASMLQAKVGKGLADKWNRKWERPLRDLAVQPGIEMERMIGVYTGQRSYRYDGLDVWPVERFLTELHGGNVF